jgi:NDP-mannose synthase
VLLVDKSRIIGFTEKPALDYSVSMGVYAMSRKTIDRYPPGLSFGFDDLMLDLLDRGDHPSSYSFDGFWLDIGRPDDYDEANRNFEHLHRILLPAPHAEVA